MNIQPIHIIDGVKIYTENQILGSMPIGSDWTYEEESAYLFGWCNAADAHYYAAPNDSFSLDNAVAATKRRNKCSVVVNNLS